MKNRDIVKIIICSNNKELAKQFEIAIKKESKYFTEETYIINEIDEIFDANILIRVIESNNQRVLNQNELDIIKNKIDNFITVDLKEYIVIEENNENKFTKNEGMRAMAFSIIFKYYLKIKNI